MIVIRRSASISVMMWSSRTWRPSTHARERAREPRMAAVLDVRHRVAGDHHERVAKDRVEQVIAMLVLYLFPAIGLWLPSGLYR